MQTVSSVVGRCSYFVCNACGLLNDPGQRRTHSLASTFTSLRISRLHICDDSTEDTGRVIKCTCPMGDGVGGGLWTMGFTYNAY
jgi:hypothetical protein